MKLAEETAIEDQIADRLYTELDLLQRRLAVTLDEQSSVLVAQIELLLRCLVVLGELRKL